MYKRRYRQRSSEHQAALGILLSLSIAALVVIFNVVGTDKPKAGGVESMPSTSYRENRTTGGPACRTEDALGEYWKANVANSRAWIEALIANDQCVFLPAGLRVSYKDAEMFGPSQVWVHPASGAAPALLWIDNEFIRD